MTVVVMAAVMAAMAAMVLTRTRTTTTRTMRWARMSGRFLALDEKKDEETETDEKKDGLVAMAAAFDTATIFGGRRMARSYKARKSEED